MSTAATGWTDHARELATVVSPARSPLSARLLPVAYGVAVTGSARRLAALLGPVLVGVSLGVSQASTEGGGPILLGVFAGLGVGVTLLAFVRPDSGLRRSPSE